MRTKGKKRNLTQEEIDEIVIAQADNDPTWDKPVRVKKTKLTSVRFPAELAARVVFLARLHREPKAEDWLRRIIKERVELEEAAYIDFKRDLAAKATQ
jgi:predicted DNA-binding protein